MTTPNIIPEEIIQSKIMVIRGKKVMLDADLAQLYQVLTKNLNKAVKRNLERFPDDFMFQLTKEEELNLRFQIGTSSWGGKRKTPYVFTELGVAMLSSVLNSERAVQVNISIMRTFTRLREIMATHEELRVKIEGMEKKYDQSFRVVFDAIKELINEPVKSGKKIGFRTN